MDTRQQAESYSHFCVCRTAARHHSHGNRKKSKVGERRIRRLSSPLPDSIAPGHYTLSLLHPTFGIPTHSPVPLHPYHRQCPPPHAAPPCHKQKHRCLPRLLFPRGGHLPTGTLTRIAFKALQADGLGANTTGYITGSTGDTIVHFRSEHLGMGSFAFESGPAKPIRQCARIAEKCSDLPCPSQKTTPYPYGPTLIKKKRLLSA